MAASADVSGAEILRDGWLYMNTEEGGSLDSWKKFWFQYSAEGLTWFKSDPTSVNNLLKEDNLAPIGRIPKEHIVSASRAITDRKFSFKIDVSLAYEQPTNAATSTANFYDKSPRGAPSVESSSKSRLFYGSSMTDRDLWVAMLQGKPLKLDDCKGFVLRIIRGKDLAARDSNGLSDPFCTVKHPTTKKEQKTSVVPKSLSPKWDESFILYIKDLSAVSEITVEVWDKDRIGKDFMGLFNVPLPKSSKDEQEIWFDLQTKPKEKQPVTGSILVQIVRDPNITDG